MISALPDRERRHLLQFYFRPKLAYGARLAWAAGLIVGALAVQVLWGADAPAPMLIVTLPILLAGNALLLVRGFDLEPDGRKHGGKWERTTRERFRAVAELQEDVRRWDAAVADITCALGVVALVAIAIVVAVITATLANDLATENWSVVFAADAVALIVPHWITGTRRGWRPVSLREQIEALEHALDAIDALPEPPRQVQPMFQMAGRGDEKTPTAARVFIRFPDGPEDFLGVQFQVAINNVQGTKYPYLYAVLVADKSFRLRKKPLSLCRATLTTPEESGGLLGFLGLTAAKDKLVVKGASEKDVDVIVIRQHTTKKSGYHTAPAAIAKLTRGVWSVVGTIAEPAAV